MTISYTSERNSQSTSPLRIVHIVSPSFGYTFSGTTTRILRLLRDWPIPDVNVSIWGTRYLDQPMNDRDLWGKAVRHTRSVRLLWSLRLLWMLIRRRHNYDVVHTHTLWWGGLLAPLLARLLRKKAIYHMSLLGSDTPSGLLPQFLGRLKLELFKKYSGVIGLTPALVDDCRQHGLTSEFLVLPGYLVFDPPAFPDTARRELARQRLAIPDQSKVLLFVGSIIQRKGVDLLVNLFIRLAGQQPNLYLLMVGARTHAENPRLDEAFVALQQDKLEQSGLSERVIWAGLVRHETELVDTYLASDLFVFPTRAEGQGYVILEAMSCGLPVVASNLEGVTDVMVIPDETGYLVSADDLDGFVTNTKKLLDDPTLRQKMGSAGRHRAVADFGFESYCYKLARFYHLVAGNTQVEALSETSGIPSQKSSSG